ncbi:hypothetical protein HPB48_017530 [Haemaphysalis longicornis]|uniref:DUF4371 domain-containing protein n=1 Tax=Haemaphysalis longicornis TaxID=44386 RepID=A0A9J6FYN1_HAELO|nr:hypothetical protein HPB48_017530 [Haemaphysalis longicornis]
MLSFVSDDTAQGTKRQPAPQVLPCLESVASSLVKRRMIVQTTGRSTVCIVRTTVLVQDKKSLLTQETKDWCQSHIWKLRSMRLYRLYRQAQHAHLKWNHALQIFDAHESTKYHRDCQLAADNFIQTFLGNAPSVVDQLDQGRQNQIRENRRKLQPVVETVLFCAWQGLALRGHRDSGPLDLSAVSAENEGNFRALLRMRADCGDTALKDHLEGCPSNASYLAQRYKTKL